MAETTISWAGTLLPDGSFLPGFTFNGWVGCQAVSPACDHCYAKTLVQRWGDDFSVRRRTSAANWKKPLKWDRDAEAAGVRRRVFCSSLADVFDNKVPEDWRSDLFDLIRVTTHLDWLLLTKRPQNIAKMLPADWGNGWPNVWLGATAENQVEADRRILRLLAVPARVRFLSCEPLLSHIDLYGLNMHLDEFGNHRAGGGIHWVIVGGESGAGARPMHQDWARSLRDQCAAAGVPFHYKQTGEWREFDTGPEITEVDVGSEIAASFLALARRPGFVADDGRLFETQADIPPETPARLMERVGKKAAGNLLDGVRHAAFPVPDA